MARKRMMTYAEKLKDPRWQKKRLKIFERDEWACKGCFESEKTLHIHHKVYSNGVDPWDYDDYMLITLCEECHQDERNLMPTYEVNLSDSVKQHFLARDLNDICEGFLNLKLMHTPDLVADMLKWMLSDENIQKELIKRYIESLKNEYHQEQRQKI